MEDDEELVLDIEEDESSISLNKHTDLARYYYGNNACAVIHGLDNLRIHVSGEGMTASMRRKYGLFDEKGNDIDIILSVQFAPDYIQNNHAPSVQYKPEQAHERSGFGQQINNLAHVFVNSRWESMHKSASSGSSGTYWMNEDRKIRKFVDLHLPKKSSISQQKLVIQRLIKQKEHKVAKALCLFIKGNKLGDAAMFYMECGGNLPESNYLMNANESNNFVAEMITYITLRVPACSTFCSICDKEIKVPFFKTGEVETNPRICTRFKCQFDYVELGICSTIPITICPSSLCSDLKENTDVVDILILMLHATCTSSRREIIFEPFPPQYQKGETRNYDALAKVVNKIPSIAEMLKHAQSEEKLKKFLTDEVYEIVKWILTCQRPALCKIPEKKRIAQMQTEHQYLLMVDSPEKTAKFNKMRKEYGSFFAYHGSSMENWSSILRNGLYNASNTKFMTTGAAYGAGIYCAPDSGTSLGYARVGAAWNKSKFAGSSNLKCLSIVEIVKHPEVQSVPNPYYVIKNPDHITTRFFFFYPNESGLNANAKDLDLHTFVQ
jgi:hypothetical protein